jgi:hypothetical protein
MQRTVYICAKWVKFYKCIKMTYNLENLVHVMDANCAAHVLMKMCMHANLPVR